MAPLKIVIVGGGLGGLACAIACRREGLDVTVLERSSVLEQVGAGIQLPPNATCIMKRWGLVDQIINAKAVRMDLYRAMAWDTGRILALRPSAGWDGPNPGVEWAEREFGSCWYMIHRADFQQVLIDEVERLGAKVRLGCHVVSTDCTDTPSVTLECGEVVEGDLIIGADGVSSAVRTSVIGKELPTNPSGMLAYRAVIPREQMEVLENPVLDPLIKSKSSQAWLWYGPKSHVMMYPVGDIFNMAIIVPDDLPEGVLKLEAEADQLERILEGWDPTLRDIVARTSNKVFKWKLVHLVQLDQWSKGNVLLLGDSCHPSPPTQAQGAAMAVEDAACLGILLGHLSRQETATQPRITLQDVLELFLRLRKPRVDFQLAGALDNSKMFHLEGTAAEERNRLMKGLTWDDRQEEYRWLWGSMRYQRELNGYDAVRVAEEAWEDLVRRRVEETGKAGTDGVTAAERRDTLVQE